MILEKIKQFFKRISKKTKMLEEGTTKVNTKENIKNRESYVKDLRRKNEIDLLELNDCEKRIVKVLNEFRKLFLQMLKDKGIKNILENSYFAEIAINAKVNYPQVASNINRVLYYYSEEDDSDEKLEDLMNLYQTIKEKVYGN